jgi:type IV secretory pathway component VirB8
MPNDKGKEENETKKKKKYRSIGVRKLNIKRVNEKAKKCKWIFYELKFSREKQQFSRVHSLHVLAFLFFRLLFNRIGIKVNEFSPMNALLVHCS